MRLIPLVFLLISQSTDPDNQIKELREENAVLKKKIEQLEKQLFEKAKELKELSIVLKQLKSQIGAYKPQADNQSDENDVSNIEGPYDPIKTTILSVNYSFNFAILNSGEKDGIKIGYIFDVYENDVMETKLGSGEITKLLPRNKSKLVFFEGNINEIKVNNIAIARRKIDFPTGKYGNMFTIKSIINLDDGKDYLINGGTRDGIKYGSRFFVLRNKKIIATLQSETVEDNFTICSLLSQEDDNEVMEGDKAVVSHTFKIPQIIGKIVRVSETNGIYIDVGLKHKVMAGQKYEVRRNGRKVGIIYVTNIFSDYSICLPVGTSHSIDDFKIDDFVELIE